MQNKIVDKFHNRQNEVENFIFMIDKFKTDEHSDLDFMNLLEVISENNLKTYSDFEQKTAKKMILVCKSFLIINK